MSKRAVILVGGLGSRLRPYTVVLPKPLMPIGPYPILEVVVRQLAASGFDRITMAVNHQADIFKAYFNLGQKWGLQIDYSLERNPLGTMGPLKLIADLPENFLVMNGDVLTDINYNMFWNHHVDKGNDFTIATCQREIRSEFGVIEINDNDTLHSFQEKPVILSNVSMGIYMLSKSIIDFIPKDTLYGFDHLMLSMMSRGHPIHIKRHEGYWLDIGRPDDYVKAIDMFEENRDMFLSTVACDVENTAL